MDYIPDNFTQKLMLLFAMEKMEIPLTENSLIDMFTNSNKWLNYMDLKQVIYELTNVGMIQTVVDCDNESRYLLTESGKTCVSIFYTKIPQSVRDNISEFAKSHMSIFKRRQEYVGAYTKNTDGSYSVTLKIKDSIKLTIEFEIKLKFPNRSSAVKAVEKWGKKAPDLFMVIYETLSQE